MLRGKQLKILVSAYACEPGKGSEPEVGWQWVRQMARYNEVFVLTRANNRSNIEAASEPVPGDNLHFFYVDLPSYATFWKKGRRGVHFYYYLWQMAMCRKANQLSRHIQFDIAHHLTFINLYMGPWLSLLPLPFIWGPAGANPKVPSNIALLLGKEGLKENRLRSLFRMTAPFRDPILMLAERRASRILTINGEVRDRFSFEKRQKIRIISQNAVESDVLAFRGKKKQKRPLHILMAGQMVSIKGYPLALRAFKEHLLKAPTSKLFLVGDGKQRKELESLSTTLKLEDSVAFVGQVHRHDLLELMWKSDVFLFPSFEGAGMVVLEAMAKALPVVCLDFGGPGEYVTGECGIKVPLTKPENVVQGLADGLSSLASDAALFERLSAGAIERVKRHYVWDRVGERLNALYREVLRESA